MKKSNLTILSLLFLCTTLFSQHATNLLPIEEWEEGIGPIGSFNDYGVAEANSREIVMGPHNYDVLGWRCKSLFYENPSPSQTKHDGGLSSIFDIDHTKTYRYMIWVRRNDFGGAFHFRTSAQNVTKLDGTTVSQARFYHGDFPEVDEWYLLVGFVHKSSYTGTTNFGGAYNSKGERVRDFTDFKFDSSAMESLIFAVLFNAPPYSSQDLYAPRVDIVNGNEPSIASLLGINEGPHIWSEITDGAVYNEGSVGIGVDETDMDPAYKFLVDGDIKTRKIKVSLDGWADYVFDDDYELLPLEKLEQFIEENGHLPEIPQEEEVIKDGVFLDEMNVKLLKKIEELTLYIIDLKKDLEQLKEEGETMKLQLKKE